MNTKLTILTGAFFLLALAGCNKDWEDHFNSEPPSSNENVWNAIQKDAQLSTFVEYMKQYQFDTLFLTNNTYTLFAPTNEAFAQFLSTGEDSVNQSLMAYLVSKYFIQTTNITGKRKIQTFMEKFALFNNTGGGVYFDEILLDFESPLYRNGKYFKMGTVPLPKLNLYEYIAFNNPILKAYIDSQDTLYMDKELSIPIDVDSAGNIIYDTVGEESNIFEEEFFPVSKEYRNKTATIVFPKAENYNAALDVMATKMTAGYTGHEDIPIKWQEDILIPYLLEHGVFENMIEREEFIAKTSRDTVKLKNILGDSVKIEYEPGELTLCSNGYAYNYDNFVVPDTLFQAPVRYEGEWWLKTQGVNNYTWYRWIKNVSGSNFPPSKEFLSTASNDTVFRVNFTKGYTGVWNVTFNVDRLFPRRYLAVFRVLMSKGGIYEFYMNDQLIRRFDYVKDVNLNGSVNSVIAGKRYPPRNGWCSFDMWVDHISQYGQAKLRIEYKGPSTVSTNGLVLDYIDFIAEDRL